MHTIYEPCMPHDDVRFDVIKKTKKE